VNWAKAWKAATRAYQRDLGSLWASFDQLWAAYQDATKLMFKALDKVSAVEEERDAAQASRRKFEEYVYKERDARLAEFEEKMVLRARVKELEGAVGEALYEIETANIDWGLLNNHSPDYDPSYKPEYPKEHEILKAALGGSKP
jgi:anti-sigma28 factor (negative regulator of flagellin synthesis)